jgi:hypothetical protein
VTAVYVAAGGGGDALASSILHRAIGQREAAVIATYAWDRLAVDPVPGPRSADEFDGLRSIGNHTFAVTPESKPRPPSDSTLPRLASEIDETLVVLDPINGARGLRQQLAELLEIFQPEVITLVDVGGDSVAGGDEPGLRSPLADGLALAACTDLPVPVWLAVAGPGLDGELPEDEVLSRLPSYVLVRLDADDVTPFENTLDWHPSEATALLVAAARGLRGSVEIRDAGLVVPLTERSREVYVLSLDEAVTFNRLAAALPTTSGLDDAERISREVCGFSEIDYEREKAARPDSSRPVATLESLDPLVSEFEYEAANRGIDFVTFRRIAEALHLPSHLAATLRAHLVATRPSHHVWPLWAINPDNFRADP